MRFLLITSVVAASFSCTASGPARLEVDRDTLVLYGGEFTWVPVSVVHDTGASAELKAKFIPRDQSVVRTSGSAVACRRAGMTDIQVELGKLTTSFVVTCRFAQRIAAESYLELEPGGPPRSLEATAVLSSGNSEVLHPISATSTDSAVAIVRDGAVVPLAVGRAGIRIDYGGVRTTMTVQVRLTIADDTVVVKPDESRAWQLAAGRYSMTVKVSSPRDLGILNMETEGLNCSRDSRDEDTIHCVAAEPAEVTLRNTSSARTARTGRAFVRIVQIP